MSPPCSPVLGATRRRAARRGNPFAVHLALRASQPMRMSYSHDLDGRAVGRVSRFREEKRMSGVRVLVGTRKGAFVLTSDGKRERWDIGGPHFGGWEMYHVKGSPADPNRLYASQTSSWFGQVIQRSNDGGRTWEAPGGGLTTSSGGMPAGESNKFVYDASPETGKPLTTHQWYDGTQRPWEF